MKLKSVKISNVLSFPFIQNFQEEKPTIVFYDAMNIFIGPNGSGKSNLIEVLSKLFQAHFFVSFEMNDNLIGFSETPNNEKPIRWNNNNQNALNTLVKHRNFKDKPSRVSIDIEFDEGDFNNLKFIADNYIELKTVNNRHCQSIPLFDEKWDFENLDLKNLFTFTADLTISNNTKVEFQRGNKASISPESKTWSPTEKFVNQYLVHFNLIQTLIELGNSLDGKNWKYLKNTFALISSMRTYNGFTEQISFGIGLGKQINELIQGNVNNSTKSYTSGDSIFRITCLKLGQYIRNNRDGKVLKDFIKSIPNIQGSTIQKINSSLKEINLKIDLYNLNEYGDTVQIGIYTLTGEQLDFLELSTGQRSILFLIFAVFGYDLENGLLLIDEPELHLHTSMQRKYFDLLTRVAFEFHLQIMVATHSPVFIDEKTIKNTYRFSKENDATTIRIAGEIQHTEKDLLQILTYTNSARIFFSDKVVLVEGDSDQYFFKYYFDVVLNHKNKAKYSVEFLSIGGKGNFKRWRTFLNLFGIQNYFIGDFDNIKNDGIASSVGINFDDLVSNAREMAIKELDETRIRQKQTKDGVALLSKLDRIIASGFQPNKDEKEDMVSLWTYLMEKQGLKSTYLLKYFQKPENSAKYTQLTKEIESRYSSGEFILKSGDLESYLNIPKDINNVIRFCKDNFLNWVDQQEATKRLQPSEETKLDEINLIFGQILG